MSKRLMNLLRLEDRCTPSGVPSTWNIRGAGGGGALFSPQFNPANPNEYYVASDMSQVFHTVNAGASWNAIDFREVQGGHESRVQYTNVNGLVYALDYTGDLVKPTKSTDGGLTWTPMASDPTGGEAVYLYADPTNSNRLVVTDYQTLYYSGNGGSTWNARYTAPNDGAGLLLGGAFWDGNSITLGTSRGLIVSINSGSTFAVEAHAGVPAGQSIISFAGGKSGATVKFVAVTLNTADVYAGLAGYENGGGGQVIAMTYTVSASWAVQTLPAGTNPFFAGMARTNANVMYAAGGSANGEPTVIKSVNGGAWTNVFNTANNSNIATGWSGVGGDRGWGYGELAMGFTVDDSNANRLIITDYGFAHSSIDGGTSWNALYVPPAERNPAGTTIPAGKAYHDNGLDNTTSWQVAWAGDDNVIIANSDVRGQLSKDDGATFGFGLGGHTANSLYRVARTPNGNLYGATGSVHDLYQSTTLQDSRINGTNNSATGAVIVSTNNGASWTTLKNFGDVVSWVATDPNNVNRLYASVVHSTAGGIFVTDNLDAGTAATWTKLANPPRTEGHPFNIVVLNDGNVVVSYSGRRTSGGAFTASSGVFLYNTTMQTWSDRSAPGMLYWTKDVVIDPVDSTQNTWYACVYSGWGGAPNGTGGLYKTTDRGLNWTRIFNSDRVASCTFNIFDTNELFVTTEVEGLWYSNNIRSTTPTFSQVNSYTFRQPERVFFNPNDANEIWVTSFGGGVMVGTNPPQAPTTAVNGGATQRSRVTTLTVTFDQPVSAASLSVPGAITLTRTTGGAALVQTGATGANGRISVAPLTGAVTSVVLTFSNANGDSVSAGVEYGSLSDGRWQLRIPAVNFTTPQSEAGLYRLFGDSNGDATIDGSDYVAFGNAFNTNSPAFDFDFNGVVDGSDLTQFGNRFGDSV